MLAYVARPGGGRLCAFAGRPPLLELGRGRRRMGGPAQRKGPASAGPVLIEMVSPGVTSLIILLIVVEGRAPAPAIGAFRAALLAFAVSRLLKTFGQFRVALSNPVHRFPGVGVAKIFGPGQNFFSQRAYLTGMR